MIFLIEYNRDFGEIVGDIRRFEDSDRETAQRSRLELELDLTAKGLDHEVVLLEASSEEIVRRTHRRYFEDLQDLASPSPPPPESELVHPR